MKTANFTEVYWRPYPTSKMEVFTKKLTAKSRLLLLQKGSTLDAW